MNLVVVKHLLNVVKRHELIWGPYCKWHIFIYDEEEEEERDLRASLPKPETLNVKERQRGLPSNRPQLI